MLDNVLTLLLFGQVGALMAGLWNQSTWMLAEYVGYGVGSLLAGQSFKTLFQWLGPRIAMQQEASKPRNMRKFADQAWHGVTHVAMFAFELYLVGRPSVNWVWWNDILGAHSTWEPTDQSLDIPVRSFYLLQLSHYSFHGISHRFHESRHNDYFVMYSHHVATLALISLSWWAESLRIGVLVLLIHDSSDIIVDLLKSCNYLGLDSKSGLFLTEGFFAMNLVTWAYTRLYLYPLHLIWSLPAGGLTRFCGEMEGGDPVRSTSARWAKVNTCLALLCVVCAMSFWWFAMFCRMGYKLLTKSVKETSQETYEGNSDDDSDDEAVAQRTTTTAAATTTAAETNRTPTLRSARQRGTKASAD